MLNSTGALPWTNHGASNHVASDETAWSMSVFAEPGDRKPNKVGAQESQCMRLIHITLNLL